MISLIFQRHNWNISIVKGKENEKKSHELHMHTHPNVRNSQINTIAGKNHAIEIKMNTKRSKKAEIANEC